MQTPPPDKPNAPKAITIFDIAKEAGVSIATVSRALRSGGDDAPRSAKQRRVLEIAAQYNYRPSEAASNLNRGRSGLSGVLMPVINHPYYVSIFDAAQEAARAQGASVVFHRLESGDEGYQPLLDRLISQRLDGLLLTGGLVESAKGPAKLAFLRHLQRFTPLVMLGEPVEGFACPCVAVDMADSTRLSVRHLAALGHRRIARIGGTVANATSSLRELGFSQEMERHGLYTGLYARLESGYTPAHGEEGVQRLLEPLPCAEWPTALVCANDLVALGAMRRLARMGLSLPGDMSVVGCDNQYFGA